VFEAEVGRVTQALRPQDLTKAGGLSVTVITSEFGGMVSTGRADYDGGSKNTAQTLDEPRLFQDRNPLE
jgi:hypothetical protein